MNLIQSFKALLCICWLLFTSIGYAHPHSFINLKTSFIVEDDKLIKIHFIWTIDELTSAYLARDARDDPKGVLNDLIKNIYDNHSFSDFWLLSDSPAKSISLLPIIKDADLDISNKQAKLSFFAKPKQPLVLKGGHFQLMTFEKTFYVDMYYKNEHDVTINYEHCQIELVKPTPDDKLLNYAASLDQDETPPETEEFVLGKLFAQKVSLKCE